MYNNHDVVLSVYLVTDPPFYLVTGVVKQFHPSVVLPLPNNTIVCIIEVVKLTTSSSKPPPSQQATSDWLKMCLPAIKLSCIQSGNIAVIIGIHEEKVITVRCFTDLNSGKCANFFGVQKSDNISALDIAYLRKNKNWQLCSCSYVQIHCKGPPFGL